ncbi:MAG: hypothetical protein EXS05_23445, partial [Planctomycetaceae bacterium]|nr:hypothetical protein [Planctomycetaceae bacterium]
MLGIRSWRLRSKSKPLHGCCSVDETLRMPDLKTTPLKNSARVVRALLAVCVLVISIYSVGAEPLASFDVNGGGGPTQTGFESLNGPGTATQNGITMNVTGGSLSRDRGTGSPVPDVTRDFLASEHPDNSDAIKVMLNGLKLGTRYRLRWHHHENANNSDGNRLALYRDNNSAPENLLFETGPYGNATTNF